MIKRLTGFICFIVLSLAVRAGEGEYAVSRIPLTLLKNANSVVRQNLTIYEIYSLTKMRIRHKLAITILNENGDRFAQLVVHYDKLRSVESIDGALYDANGNELKSVKNKDIRDYSNVDEISLMDDSRVKVHEFHHRVYPYTVMYEQVIEYNNTFMFPDWYSQRSSLQSVETAVLQIKGPAWFKYQHRSLNFPAGSPVITEDKDSRVAEWKVSNLPAIVREYGAPDIYRFSPCVFLSPEQFEIQGYKGSMNSWKEFGIFFAKLNAGRDQLPDHIKKKVHDLSDGITDVREKVRVLYEYMQQNTRYISVQLGIGGFQTFDANYVATKSYGDCKALSNYMYSLLKEAGIKSCYTLVYSGEEENFYLPDFVYNQFNHIILNVPMPKDTIWLECTSQTLPAGYLSGFTSDRYVLAITEDGGKLVHTPKYGLNENVEDRKVFATLDEESGMKIKAVTNYSGQQQDFYQKSIRHMAKDKVKEWLGKRFDLATYDITGFDYAEQKGTIPWVKETIDMEVKNYATITGKRVFIVPNILTRHSRKLSADSTRKYDIEFVTEYKDVDTVEISLPAGYALESSAKDLVISSKFGKYTSSVKLSGNTLYYFRKLEHYSGIFPAKDYAELVSFYESVYKADRTKVVLVKTETPLKGF
jgi:Domain of Unknown Function with PDB structure (DUF3857)